MPTDPNDKMRTPGAAARRDMDGRAYGPKPKRRIGCPPRAAAILVVLGGSAFGLVEAARAVTS